MPAGKAMAAVKPARAALLRGVRRIEPRPVLPVAQTLQPRGRAVHHQTKPVVVRTQAVRGPRGQARPARPNSTLR
jgi:hypothetical protein